MPKLVINDIEINYMIQGEGDYLVLLHGVQGDATSFSHILDSLSDHFTVIAFDQRGSGKSSKPDTKYTMELLAHDTACLMNALSIESAHIFGISLGGMIGQAFSITYPDMVKSLTIGCSLPGGWEHAQKKESPPSASIAFSTDTEITNVNRAVALAEVAYSPGYSKRHPEIIDMLIRSRNDNPIHAIGFQRRCDITGYYNGFSTLVKIACPCLIVTGKLDQLIDYRNSIILAEQIKGSDLLILGHSGHVFWEEQKDVFLSAFLSFTKNSSKN